MAVILTLSVRLIGESGRNVTVVFYSVYAALWFLTDLYWLVYDLLRPEIRMPFAANEFGEAAVFLMLAAMVGSEVDHRAQLPLGYLVGTLVFAACNVILWIVWSGEVAQDVIVGAALGWLYYNCVRSLRWSRAFDSGDWICLGTLCAGLILCQGLTFPLSGNAKVVSELTAYGISLAGILFLGWKLFGVYRKDLIRERLFLSVTLLMWITTSKYMSGGNWYYLFMNLETVLIPLCFVSVRKAVKTA